jgi:hypothetical protein
MKADYSKDIAEAWRGHHPVTSMALLSLLDRAAAGQLDFSRVERHLWVASEFWAAVNSCELDAHLDSAANDPLCEARFAFSSIGAEHVVDALYRAAVGAAGTQPRAVRRHCIADLENELLRVPDPVDVLIARFASRYLRSRRLGALPVRKSLEFKRHYRHLLA